MTWPNLLVCGTRFDLEKSLNYIDILAIERKRKPVTIRKFWIWKRVMVGTWKLGYFRPI